MAIVPGVGLAGAMNETEISARLPGGDALAKLLAGWRAARLLALGEDRVPGAVGAEAVCRPWPEAGPRWLERVLDGLGRFDAVWVHLPGCPAEPATQLALLARVRDLHAPRVAVTVEAPERAGCVDVERIRALGFAVGRCDGEGRLCTYEMARYKTTPDWFGPSGWAHPERWDRDRW